MSEEAQSPNLDPMAALAAALKEQPSHPVIPKVRVGYRKNSAGTGSAGSLQLMLWVEASLPVPTADGMKLAPGEWVPTDGEGVFKVLSARADTISRMDIFEGDPFNDGYEPPAWDEIDWEICRLRVRNPGVVIQPAVFGANGSGKTFYACSRTVHFLAQANKGTTAWSFTLDETNSEAVNQKWMRYYLPLEYKTDKGSIAKTASAGLNWGEKGGFTDNKFSLHNGASCEYRFYSKEIGTNEGVRPAFAWMDEEFADAWLDAVERRLLTFAGKTREHIPMWEALLRQKAANPDMKFPREKLGMLLMGVQLITFTCKKGYTPTVRAFRKGAVPVREIEAKLLPKKNEAGDPDGYEMMPKLLYCSDPKRIIYYLHAWDNPFGGNWEGMQIMARKKSRKEILWWCYGETEETSGVMWAKFARAAHVRPLWFLPTGSAGSGGGTWFMFADPNDGKRNWTMGWVKVNTHRDKFIAREWPQQDDFIPGEGHLGPWAIAPTGKRVDGDVGPAQASIKRGFQFIKDEIARVERELYWVEQTLAAWRKDTAERRKVNPACPPPPMTWDLLKPPPLPDDAPKIEVHKRFMDARAGNTDTLTHGAAKTLIEVMKDDYGLKFEPVDKDHGTVEGSSKSVGHGAKLVENALDYDETQATLDVATGHLTFKGKAPSLYVCGGPPAQEGEIPRGCENHIFAFETWTYQDGGEGACKDFADIPRWIEMMDVKDMSDVQWSSGVRDGAREGRSAENEIGDWAEERT